jgi:hypothetical protein
VTAYAFASALLDPYTALPVYVAGYVMPIALVMWAMFDARRRRATPCFDFGMLLMLFWYVSIPWYLVATRGWRGWGIAVMFAALMLAPIVVYACTLIASLIIRSIAGAPL